MSLHCWADGSAEGFLGTTCMLPDGHDAPHLYTRDADIQVQFAESDYACGCCSGPGWGRGVHNHRICVHPCCPDDEDDE